MKRIAIFVEGQAEQIFIRYLLVTIFDWSKFSFTCVKLYADQMQDVPYNHNVGQSHVEVHFLIVDAANDRKVLSAIKEREQHLFAKGYDEVFGLRDMYSEEYCKHSDRIQDAVTSKFIDGATQSVSLMSCPERIHFHFAIMELEAWFLGMYTLFRKMKSTLDTRYLQEGVGYDLSEIDPQTQFFKPADELDRILRLVGLRYRKHSHEVNSILSGMDSTDCEAAVENGRCQSFDCFYSKLQSVSE